MFIMSDGMENQSSDSDPTPPVRTSILPGQFPVYRTYKPKDNFENKAKIAWSLAMMGIIILPLGAIATYIAADALAGMSRAKDEKGKNDALVALALGVIEVAATIAFCLWYSNAHSFIRLLSK